VLSRLREQGQSLLIVEESSRRALEFVDRACVIKLGTKALEDRADSMREDGRLLEAYFGIPDEAAKPLMEEIQKPVGGEDGGANEDGNAR